MRRSPAVQPPSAESVAELLEGVVGCPVTVERAEVSSEAHPQAPLAIAVYARDDGWLGGVCLAELALLANAGAALAMIPPRVAHEGLGRGLVSDDIQNNFREILHVMAGLFAGVAGSPVQLLGMRIVPAPLPDVMQRLIDEPGTHLELDVSIEGYGKGKLALLHR